MKNLDYAEYNRLSKLRREIFKKEVSRSSDQDYFNAMMVLDAAEHGIFLPDTEEVFSRLDSTEEFDIEQHDQIAEITNYSDQRQISRPSPNRHLDRRHPFNDDQDVTYQFSLVVKDYDRSFDSQMTGVLGGAQSSARRLAEAHGKIVDIYQNMHEEWVWVDKIYPSEASVLSHRTTPLISPKSKSTSSLANLCPVCSAQLEYLTFDDKPVLLLCPNGHDIDQ